MCCFYILSSMLCFISLYYVWGWGISAMEEGLTISPPPPETRSFSNMAYYILVLPIILCLKFTVPDVRQEK